MTHNLIDEEVLAHALATRAEDERVGEGLTDGLLTAMRRDVRSRRLRRRVGAGAGAAAVTAALLLAFLPGGLTDARSVPPAAPTSTGTSSGQDHGIPNTPEEEVRFLDPGPAPAVPMPYLENSFASREDFERPSVIRLPDGRRTTLDAEYPTALRLAVDDYGAVGLGMKIDDTYGMQTPPGRIFAVDDGTDAVRTVATGRFIGLALSPDGTQVAAVAAAPKLGQMHFVVILERATGREVRRFPIGPYGGILHGWARSGLVAQRLLAPAPQPGQTAAPSASPDNLQPGPLEVLSPEGRTLRVVAQDTSPDVVVSPALDRAVLWASSPRGTETLTSVDLATGAARTNVTAVGDGMLELSRDGRRIVLGRRVYDTATLDQVAKLPVGYQGQGGAIWEDGFLTASQGSEAGVTWYTCSWSGKPECHRLENFPPRD